MSKKKILLGMLIVMLMSVCSTFLGTLPSVFATETIAPTTIQSEAGTFYGQGYYVVGEQATLTAVMNPGYCFDAWASVDDEGNVVEELSYELEYTFEVEKDINIKAIWHKIDYTIDFDNDLKDDNGLKDFTYQIINKTQQEGKNYYNDEVEIQVNIKQDLYIYDLVQGNITIKDVDGNIITIDSAMNVQYDITNNQLTGFDSFVITLNIQQDLIIDIEYDYLYKLQILSGYDSVDVKDIIQFLTITNDYSKLDDCTYLVRENKEVVISVTDNEVYKLESYQFQNEALSNEYSKGYILKENSAFTLYYSKKEYTATFKSYVINLTSIHNEMANPLYNISPLNITAGDTVNFSYNNANKQFVINGTNYEADNYQAGYNFVGFYMDGMPLSENSYTLSEMQPTNVEIQLVFEYIKYSFEIQLVDEYFEDGVTYSYTYNNTTGQLITGTRVQVQAETSKYVILGWSWSNNPKTDGYLVMPNENATSNSYTFTFEPTSDDNSQTYIMYLDIDYKYSSVTYQLQQDNVVQNVSYDIVSVDLTNKTIIFKDSSNILIDKQVDYLDEDISINGTTTTINTQDFGTVVIQDNVLSYNDNGVEVKSSSKVDEQGVSIYTFDKYIYFGQLQAGVVQYLTLSQDEDNVTITLIGNIYSDNGVENGVINSIITTMEYNTDASAYKIEYYSYDMYLYMNEANTEYDYIIFRDIKYYFDGEKFEVKNATINTKKGVEYVVTKNSSYSIQLSNLLSNDLIVYSTQSTNETNYGFTSFISTSGSNLTNFDYSGYKFCILNAVSNSQITAEYRKFENSITLHINNEKAYDYNNISFTVNGVSGSGKTISAIDGDEIIIVISNNYISKGYQFENYRFNDNILTDANNPMILQITMDSRIYANQIIDICFKEIEYTININYINNSNSNGKLLLNGGETTITSLTVTLSGEYTFNALANNGYYVSEAYIGTQAYIIDSLMGNNKSEIVSTKWILSSINFEQAIIDNADSENIINLYINFEIHKYSVKIYFEINEGAGVITYPNLYINNVKESVIAEQEEVDGIVVTKYYVSAKDMFEYGSNVSLHLNNFMLGTSLQSWQDENNNQLSNSNQYTIVKINEDVVLTVILQYIKYSAEFVIVDEQGNECNYGSASSDKTIIKLFDNVNYVVNSAVGYVLDNKYYYDSSNQIGTNNIESGFVFNPAHFKIEDGYKFKIYLVFVLKIVNLEISNTIEGSKYYFKNYEASDLASYTVTRQRGNVVESLNNETGYEFRTGDILTMEITTISIGIDLNMVKLGNINITVLTGAPYELTPVDIVEDGKVVGMYYRLKIEFTAGLIDTLASNVALNNVLVIKTYNITYTYNFINFKFGITLIRHYNNTSSYGDEDMALNINGVGFGSGVTFSYVYEGMATGIGNKFKINGFLVEGIKQDYTNSFTLEEILLWEQIALTKYQEKNNEINVVLLLSPKITLDNYSQYTLEDGYLYERAYNGNYQGLATQGLSIDVVVGGNFDIVIKYDSGNGFSTTPPIDAGDYQVQIIAKITSNDSQTIDVEFDENVVYRITPAMLQISFSTYSSSNPITKTYDGTNNLSSSIIANDIKFDGIYDRDKGQLHIDATRLSVKLSGILVNTNATLYDLNMFDIYLLDNSNNTSSNYKLASGQNLVFARIAKINPKELNITGFKVYNKVYDGTNSVTANIDDINFVGKLESDSTQILAENLKFYLEKFDVGFSREVKIDWENALVGADSINYSITYDKKYIDIHPYEISYTLNNYGTFKIVDADRLCLIPIQAEMTARVFEKGSAEYRSLYSIVESEISRGEKLKYCYEITMRVGFVEQLVPDGLYVFIPKVNKITKVVQVTDNEKSPIEYLLQNNYTILKVGRGDGTFAVVSRTVYLPLWLIILIVCLILLLITIIVMIFILIRRKAKQKYSSYDKI